MPPATATRNPPAVIALAASLGGIAALSGVLGALPAGLPAAVLVVQHLWPGQQSVLAEILDTRTSLRVRQAGHGDALQAGVVHVAPSDRHLRVCADDTLALLDTERVQRVRPSADVLFGSLAEHCGARAIAVVLTGTGHDGSEGLRAVHEAGGATIAQDRASSASWGMPGSAVATGAVDRVLPLRQIPFHLITLATERRSA